MAIPCSAITAARGASDIAANKEMANAAPDTAADRRAGR
jgi:hypothetical protein